VREYEFKTAIDEMMALAAFGNNYIQNNAPWKLIKSDREAAMQVIKNCLSIVHALALIFEPVIPGKAQAIWEMLGNTDSIADHQMNQALVDLKSGLLPVPKPLFEKLDDGLIHELDLMLQKRVEEAGKKGEKMERISFEEFGRLDIRVGTVLSAEPVPKSNKLLKLQVDIGSEKRQVVAGMAQFYSAEDLVGKQVIVVVNLEPAKIFGIESNGMILAAGDEASLLVPLKPVNAGEKIR